MRKDGEKYLEQVRHIQLFSSLTDEELTEVLGKLFIKECEKNEALLRQEESNSSMYIVLQGEAKVFQINDEGKEIIIALIGDGEYFGEMSLIDEDMTSASVVATRKSAIALLSREDFFSLLYANKKVLDNVLKALCARIRGSTETIHMLSYLQAQKRITLLLKRLARKSGRKKDPSGITLAMKLTHQSIADMTGLTRQTTTKVMDELKRKGLVSMTEDKHLQLHGIFLDDEW